MPLTRAFEANFDLYNTPRAVGVYSRMTGLSRAETAILRGIEARLPSMDVLDLGVGAGRTTRAFASIARTYVGVDFASPMVDACRAKYPALDFRVADARDLSIFPDESFDFVLFSFNGVDCLAFDHRSCVFNEVRRVLRPGGTFVFSSHNAGFLDPMTPGAVMRLALRPGTSLKVVARKLSFLSKKISVDHVSDGSHAVVFERQHGHEVPIVYTRPEWQTREIAARDFNLTATISNATGEVLTSPTDLLRLADAWLYYVCEKPE
jgi:ubiquinone/menaquinone biosynthesis C-methylase UbiE